MECSRFTYLGLVLRSRVVKEVVRSMAGFALMMLLCLIGGFVLCALEYEAEQDALAKNVELQARLISELSANTTSELFERGWLTADLERLQHWDISHSHSRTRAFLFAFTVASTIGYGTTPLRSVAGRAFAGVFSVIGIPVMIIVYTYLSARLLAMVIFLLDSLSWESTHNFSKHDADLSGMLSVKEFRRALRDQLDRDFSEYELMRAMQENDLDGDASQITYVEYCMLLQLLRPAAAEKSARRHRLEGLFIITVLWLLVGTFAITSLEGWSTATSLWFCWITLSTIGFGDYFPVTSEGEVFVVMWATIGLGIVGMVIADLAEAFTKTHFLDRLAKELSSMSKEHKAYWDQLADCMIDTLTTRPSMSPAEKEDAEVVNEEADAPQGGQRQEAEAEAANRRIRSL